MGRTRRVSALLALAAVSLGAAACGSDQPAATVTTSASAPAAASSVGGSVASSASAFPVTVRSGGGTVTVTAAPKRIVSLSATATESLFAIGAGPQVTAVDDQSNYPANAPKTKLSSYQPNLEAITTYNPDLVVSSQADDVTAGLSKLGIPVAVEPAAKTLDEAYGQIADLGALTGHATEADKVVSGMKARIAKAVSSRPAGRPLTYYHELDDTYYSVTSSTFIGQVYKLLGLTSIADTADKAGSGYPQLSSERIVAANPDLILLADTKCCSQSAATLAARPGWASLDAIRSGRVVALDDDIASRWGPRLPELVEQVAAVAAKAAG